MTSTFCQLTSSRCLPGCAAAGDTRQEAEANIREAVKLHLEGLRQDGDPI
ncbi:MAG: type II toxin-antitoxin system HicB family antitoxin, partial [Gemmatimonadetes bacterium]|nr:type II toxin-antitoxin system HicB family antitoxin [Gemmatimonadota bacterium]